MKRRATIPFLSRLRRDERGSPTVEFALILPLVAMSIAGLFEFAVLYLEWDTAHQSAGKIARWAYINVDAATADDNSATIESNVEAYAASVAPGFTVDAVYVNPDADSDPCSGNRAVRLNVSFTHTFQAPFIGSLAGGEFDVSFTTDQPIYCKPDFS